MLDADYSCDLLFSLRFGLIWDCDWLSAFALCVVYYAGLLF